MPVIVLNPEVQMVNGNPTTVTPLIKVSQFKIDTLGVFYVMLGKDAEGKDTHLSSGWRPLSHVSHVEHDIIIEKDATNDTL